MQDADADQGSNYEELNGIPTYGDLENLYNVVYVINTYTATQCQKKNLISRINIWNEIIIFLPQVQLGHVCTGKGILIHWKLKKGGSKKEKTGRAFLSGKLKSAFRYHLSEVLLDNYLVGHWTLRVIFKDRWTL